VTPKHNLVPPLTSFVGREREVDGLMRLLTPPAPAPRLVTLIGPGGSGKTRLAHEIATRMAAMPDAFPDGTWLVELASISDPHHIAGAVAATLGIREQPHLPLLEALANALAFRRLLLVLDNCEHLADGCAQLIELVLRSCASVRVLATSRQVLGVAGETIWRMSPLSLPEPRGLPPLERLVEYGAIRLFLDRARLRDPDFELTADNAGAVVQICRQLDGVPLDVELAAARVLMLPVESLASRLDQRLRLLSASNRSASPRHRSLRAAVDWSYDLLDEEEQSLFRQLAVFAGGFTVEAAQAISDHDVFDLLARLVEKTMVEPRTGDNDRYRLLETLRQYAEERLEGAEEANVTRERHATFFLRMAEKAEGKMTGNERELWLGRLQRDLGNLRAALTWFLQHGRPDSAARLAGALTWFWFLRGHLSEGRTWLARALEAEHIDGASDLPRAKALCAAGTLAYMQGDVRQSLPLLEQSLVMCRRWNDERGVALATRHLGAALLFQGENPVAEGLIEESVHVYRELGETWETAFSLHFWGNAALFRADLATARSRYEQSLGLFAEINNTWGMALELNGLGNVSFQSGDHTAADHLYDRSLQIRRELDEPWLVANSLCSLADVARHQGDCYRARSLYQEGLLVFRDLGDRRNVAACIAALVGLSLENAQRTATLLTAVDELLTATGARLEPPDQADVARWLEQARGSLGDAAFATAQTLGR
ncbi:MAG TPA: tetratricopeptide repeat protein, partial [Chloroflexota bacterium]|nr:tetratricopeptide repeat protein [Chloroflexota bacterium]